MGSLEVTTRILVKELDSASRITHILQNFITAPMNVIITLKCILLWR
jgi:hypothetical protein